MRIFLALLFLAQTFFTQSDVVVKFGYDFTKVPSCGEAYKRDCVLSFEFYEISKSKRTLISTAFPPKDSKKNESEFATVLISPNPPYYAERKYVCEKLLLKKDGSVSREIVGEWRMTFRPWSGRRTKT